MDGSRSGLTVDEFLAHYGVKGMKWGVRKNRNSVTPSEDFKSAAAARAKVTKKGNTAALSNAELQALNKRMNLENEFARMDLQRQSVGRRFVKALMGDAAGIGRQQAKQAANQVAAKKVAEQLNKRG